MPAGDAAAALAFDVYAYRSASTSAPTSPCSASVDAIVFTAGVGEHSPELRAAALGGLERLGIVLDPRATTRPVDGRPRGLGRRVGVAVLVVPTDEEWEIARQALAVVRGGRDDD